MADGSNQPTPLVHDGVMYLTNAGNIIQALDARTGDVIWQYAREFPEGFSTRGFNQLRNISIYGDKLFLSTKDAALVALDARTGDVVWEHQIADPTQGLHERQRTDGDARAGRQRHQRMPAVPGGELLHHGPRPEHRRGAVAHAHDR